MCNGRPQCLYGDPVYGWHEHLCSPLAAEVGGGLTEDTMTPNKIMSQCMVTVEMGFEEVTCKWPFVDMTTQQTCLLSKVTRAWMVAERSPSTSVQISDAAEMSSDSASSTRRTGVGEGHEKAQAWWEKSL